MPTRMPRLVAGVISILAIMITMAPSATAQMPRILLVGDSWAEYVWNQRTIKNVLADNSMSYYEGYNPGTESTKTAYGGTTAAWWISDPANLARIDAALAANPTIKIVHLSIGGNDFLWEFFNPADDAATRAGKWSTLRARVQTMVDYILGIDPDLKVVLCGYTFVKHPFYPSNQVEVNQAIIELSQEMLDMAQNTDRLEFVLNLGLMQHLFDYLPYWEAGDLPAPGVYPDYLPFPGGDPDYSSPPGSLTFDGFHLQSAGYYALVENCFDQFYSDWLVGPVVEAIYPEETPHALAGFPRFVVVFSEAVTGVDVGDFTLSATGLPEAHIASVSGSGDTYYVTVSTGDGAGIVELGFVDDDSVINSGGDPSGGVGADNTPVVDGSEPMNVVEELPMAAWPVLLGLALVCMAGYRRWSEA